MPGLYAFRFDPAAFRAQVLNAGWMEAEMRARAERGLSYAESIAPRESGEYADSFHIESGRDGGWNHDRAYAILENLSDHALYVEYTNGNYVLHRSLDVMGG